MTVHYADDQITLHHGRDLDVLRTLPDGSVNCVVTSPPYFGLRDYGVDGQRGLEASPAEYVAGMVEVFAEVRRVLADDGTCWLNLGDSYAVNGRFTYNNSPNANRDGSSDAGARAIAEAIGGGINRRDGIAAKNLLGIPWMVARALQQPYYTGRIRNESDRAWLAGWLDGEGTISYVERDRGPDHTPTHDIRAYVTNCDRAPLDEFAALCGGRINVHRGGDGHYGDRTVYRWQMGTHDSASLIRELFPYLRTKRRQASLIWTLYTTLRHNNGHARTPADVVARRREIAEMVRSLNRGNDVALPAWVADPPSHTEPGWVLRNAVVWAKPNAMPESVTDRLSTRYELVFLLTKARRYWFDLDAIREPHSKPPGSHRGNYAKATAGAMSVGMPRHLGLEGDGHESGRNPGDVWTIPTAPFAEAHFAVMPLALAERCIQAGCPLEVCAKCGEPRRRITERPPDEDPGRSDDAKYQQQASGLLSRQHDAHRRLGAQYQKWLDENPKRTVGWSDCGCGAGFRPGVVLDPYSGSGTTGHAALRHGRRYIGIDLSAEYLDLSLRTRLQQGALIPDTGDSHA